jgi:hypothetical protein
MANTVEIDSRPVGLKRLLKMPIAIPPPQKNAFRET